MIENGKVITGNYTLLLHEGFIAFVNNMVFNNFWRYNSLDQDTFESVWYQTMIGWYHTIAQNDDEQEQWGWFYGYKYHVQTMIEYILNKMESETLWRDGQHLADQRSFR